MNEITLKELENKDSPFKRSISVNGGFKDEYIEENWSKSKHFFHASTMAIDRVWIEADHKCIIWCNQLVR